MKKFIFAPFILGFLGFLDASYLTIVHYKHIVPPCSIAHGCETVLNSQFSMIGPIPIALVGALFYVTFMGLLGLYFETKKKLFFNAALLLSASSIVVSIYLVYL